MVLTGHYRLRLSPKKSKAAMTYSIMILSPYSSSMKKQARYYLPMTTTISFKSQKLIAIETTSKEASKETKTFSMLSLQRLLSMTILQLRWQRTFISLLSRQQLNLHKLTKSSCISMWIKMKKIRVT